eukprot:UN27023
MGSWDNSIYIYNTSKGRVTQQISRVHSDSISDLVCNNKVLISSSWDYSVKVWNIKKDGVSLDKDPIYKTKVMIVK